MNTTTELNFGLRTEQLLLQRKIAPRDFYDAVGIRPQYFYDLKKGSMPSARIAIKIAQFFGVPIEWLVNGEIAKSPMQQMQQKIDTMKHEMEELQRTTNEQEQVISELRHKLAMLRDYTNEITKDI